THSNTYALERDRGWKGLLIDANPAYVEALKRYRKSTSVLSCIDREVRDISFLCLGYMGGIVADDTDYAAEKRGTLLSKHFDKIIKVRSRPLADVLDAFQAPQRIQYLSVDVEGAEHRVVGAFPFDRYVFEAITIERPTHAV